VWLSYAVSLFSLIVLVVVTVNKKRKILSGVSACIEREQRMKNAQNMEGTL
jgi:heme exporter protein D